MADLNEVPVPGPSAQVPPPPDQPGAVLTVQDLFKDFAGLRAVDNVSLQLRTGEILGLIGPNGSGKTTFINLITGLLPKSGGFVVIDQVDTTHFPAAKVARAGLARTFQTIRLFKELTCLENVEAGAVGMGVPRRQAEARAIGLLEEIGLADQAGKRAKSLTFAGQRRLEIARALAAHPKFLLLDEPAAGLNEEETAALLAFLKPLPAAKGIGILIVDHDMHLIMNLCDRIHVLNYGKTIAEGTPAEVRANPEVVGAYLGSAAR
ncbi:MAG: ABC transporter ATP-binding protein [Bifidobacteriaceae bacterium]|jgi:branched-chain amino acid transport system ATP-binding protein|nr:ABC transporter ATP-binding protein [Bifidobacteriaceae bacterium]